jgi:hypothetical protein
MLHRFAVLTVVAWLLAVTGAASQAAPVHISLLESHPIRIGGIDGQVEPLFVGIVGATRLPSGDLVVGDGGDHAIHFFDGSGRWLRSVGREGAGPGEFRYMAWFGRCADGDLLAVDVVLGRATILDVRGEVRHTVDTPEWFRFNQVLSCRAGKTLTVLADHPPRLGTPGRVTRFPAAVVEFELGATRVDTLAALAGTEYYFASGVQAFSPYPLGAAGHAAAGGRILYAAQNDEPFIRVVDLASRRSRTIEHGLPRPPVTAAAWQGARSAIIDRQPLPRTREILTRVLDEAPIPRSHPTFMELTSDEDDRVWIRLPSADSATTWRVLNQSGRHLADIEVPNRTKILEIGRTHLIALTRDELDVQYILVYIFPIELISP